MHNNRFLAVLVGLCGLACGAVTTAIIYLAGEQQTATSSGHVLAAAAIVVHIGGVVVFGSVTGWMLRAGKYFGAFLCSLIVLGGAAYSGWQVATFATAELISVTKAHERAEQRETDRYKAELDAAAEQRKTQAKLAEQHLRWLQIETRNADGRRDKKDGMEAGAKLVADMGKVQTAVPSAPPPTPQPPVQTDAFPRWVAGLVGWDKAALQASPTVWLAFMTILLEIVAWPLMMYMWLSGGAPPPTQPTTTLTLAAMQSAQPPAILQAEPAQRALPPPKTREPKALTVRATPSHEWRALLDRLDFPPNGARHKGPRREKDSREHVALRFLAWLGAYKESGDYPQAEIDALYAECCAMDHREQWGIRVVKAELEALGSKVASKWTGSDGLMWTVNPPPIDKLTAMLERRGALTPSSAGRTVVRFPAA